MVTFWKSVQAILAVALLCGLCSYLFFGRAHDLYVSMWLVGNGIAFVAFISLLFRKHATGLTLRWLAVVMITVGAHYWGALHLTEISLKRYIQNHRLELEALSAALGDHEGMQITKNTLNQQPALIENLASSVHSNFKKAEVTLIYIGQEAVYFELWGYLDNRIAVVHCTNPDHTHHFRSLGGDWYH